MVNLWRKVGALFTSATLWRVILGHERSATMPFIPWLVPVCVIALVVLARFAWSWNFAYGGLQRLEWLTFDWRARHAAERISGGYTNIGLVTITDESIEQMKKGVLGFKAGLYWPRHVYGRAVRELAAQGASVIALDTIFTDRRPDHPPIELPGGDEEVSDRFFGRQLRAAGNVILASADRTLPDVLFRTNAWAVGDVTVKRDADGVIRRCPVFEDYLIWHPLIREAAETMSFDLKRTLLEPERLVLCATDGRSLVVPLDDAGLFNLRSLSRQLRYTRVPWQGDPMANAFRTGRVWDLGLVAAAKVLRLDLEHPIIDSKNHRIILKGPGVERIIPVDSENCFYIDWQMTTIDARIPAEPIERVLLQDRARQAGLGSKLVDKWRGKVVLIGSLTPQTDHRGWGATPLEGGTAVTGRFLNIMHSLLTGRFIHPLPFSSELALIAALSLSGLLLTVRLRFVAAGLGVVTLGASYLWLGDSLYCRYHFWLPEAAPLKEESSMEYSRRM